MSFNSTTVKPALSSHTRKAQKVAAYSRWLLNRGEYQYKFNVWEHFVWLLKTGCCLIEVTANTGLTVLDHPGWQYRLVAGAHTHSILLILLVNCWNVITSTLIKHIFTGLNIICYMAISILFLYLIMFKLLQQFRDESCLGKILCMHCNCKFYTLTLPGMQQPWGKVSH